MRPPSHMVGDKNFSGSAMPPTPRRSIRRSAVCPSNMAPIGAKLCQNAFQTIPVKSIFGRKKIVQRKFSVSDNTFCLVRSNFGGRTGKRTSKSNSSQFFALDGPILMSVQPKIDEFMSVSAIKTLGGYRYFGVQVLRGHING